MFNGKIVFIHDSDSWYLPYALYQAKSLSPNSEVVLLGPKVSYPNIANVSLEDLQGSSLELDFRKAYVHMSANSESFEFFCFLRWYYLLQFMRRTNTNAVFCYDSDVLLYSSASEIFEAYHLKDFDCGYLVLGEDEEFTGVTAGTSFWTQAALEKFCDFMTKCYCQKQYLDRLKNYWEKHSSEKRSGGVTDMTMLRLFHQERLIKATNLTFDQNGNVFDPNINRGDDFGGGAFEIADGQKKVEFINGKPMFFRVGPTKELAQAHLLHFQGGAKGKMPLYYTGGYFQGKTVSDLKGLAYRLRGNWRELSKKA